MRIFALLASLFVLASVTACGGGEDSDPGTANTFQAYTVDVDRASAKAGTYIAASAEFKTLGPTIESVTWSYMLVGNAAGTLTLSDETCTNAQVNVRSVAGSDKKASTWRCETTVMGPSGSKGQFRLVATAVDSDGNTARDETVVTITP